MKKIRNMNKRIVVSLVLIMMMLVSTVAFAEDDEINQGIEKGKAVKIIKETVENLTDYDEGKQVITQEIEVKVTTGKNKGETFIVENVKDDRFAYNIDVEQGDGVVLYFEYDEDGEVVAVYISEILREKYIYWVIGTFFILLLLVGKMKGLKTILTLFLTGFAILKIYLPLTLEGHNPIFLSTVISIGVTVLTLFAIGGINKKTFSAIIGTIGGVLTAGIIVLTVGAAAKLTGLGNDEAQYLMFIPQQIDFDFRGILFSGIILGALGAVMDVSMSISSSINEMVQLKEDVSFKQLLEAGMNVGKDIMGTMSNTLILAYTGGSIHLMLLFMAHDLPLIDILNRDMVATEIIRAFAGSIGLVITIPLTALVAATKIRGKDEKVES